MSSTDKGNRGSILVVDDTPDNLAALLNMLTRTGYYVRPTLSGRKALNALRELTVDLILLDIIMPEMDGYTVCDRLKSDPRTRDIPVIFISGLSETIDKVEAFKHGCVDYVTKPFVEEEVIARINTHITLRRQQIRLKEERERFQKLSEAAFEGVIIHDNGRILEANQAVVEISGFHKNDLIGKNFYDLLPPELRGAARRHFETTAEKPLETSIKKQDGATLPVEMQERYFTWSNRSVRMVALRDISWRTVLAREYKTLELTLGDEGQFGNMVGKSPEMRKVYENILRAAATDFPVAIYGETGTGKELTARMIFELSSHHKACFVPVNCASIPENLFESQFFGHSKGAFTGADRDHAGYFQLADGGTLFLDEVAELPLTIQAKFLRVLEDMVYLPLGAKRERKSDVRIITASNKDMRMMMQQGKIRCDLFYRLQVLNIDLPPLRWRKEDIPLLIEHFLNQQASERVQGSVPPIPLETLNRLSDYDWPGNVRELFNEVRRWLSGGEMELAGALPDKALDEVNLPSLRDDLSLNEAVERFERHYIPRILQKHGGYKAKTAETLKVDRKTLYRKLKKYGMVE